MADQPAKGLQIQDAESLELTASLPLEVLSEIFLHCTNGAMDDVNTIKKPLLLSQICTKWRAAALCTPRLWSRMFICISQACAASQGSLMETWMARSGVCPLTIFLFWEESTQSTSHPAVEAMIGHCTRWQNMLIFMPLSAFGSLTSVANQLPLLGELSLGTGDKLSDSISYTVRTMFQHAPRLRSFECVNIRPFQFAVPWTQLREIPVISACPQECVEVLRRSSVLEEATLVPIDHVPALPMIELSVTSSVKRLTLLSDPLNPNVSTLPVFEKVSAPDLVFLKVAHSILVNWLPMQSFLMPTALTVLELRRAFIPSNGLISCLRSTPSLVRLIVELVPFGPPLFDTRLLRELAFHRLENSTDQAGSGYLVPKLTDFAVLSSTLVHTGPFVLNEAFIDMIDSRFFLNQLSEETSGSMAAVSRMRWVRIKTRAEYVEPEIYGRVAALRRGGLDIVFGPTAYA